MDISLRRHLAACSTLPPTSEFQVTKKYLPTLTFWIRYQKSENKQHLGKGYLLLCRNYMTISGEVLCGYGMLPAMQPRLPRYISSFTFPALADCGVVEGAVPAMWADTCLALFLHIPFSSQ